MPRKKRKFGKMVTLYLSYEAIKKLEEMSYNNKSGFVEVIIKREYDKLNNEKEEEIL